MRTYVEEINGEALITFRAKGDDEAYDVARPTAWPKWV
jgi:hypothetical protein